MPLSLATVFADLPDPGLAAGLDVSFTEDDSRTRCGHAAANLGRLRRVELSLVKRTKTKGSIKTRRLKGDRDDNYLLQVLQEITANHVRTP